MNVLLLGGIPDPLKDPNWYEMAEPASTRLAALALCTAVGVAGGTMTVLREHVETQPLFAAHLRTAMQTDERVRLVDDLGAPESLAGVTHVVFIGGTERELRIAELARQADVRVYPIGSTGAAAQHDSQHAHGFSQVDRLLLLQDANYPALFAKLLSI